MFRFGEGRNTSDKNRSTEYLLFCMTFEVNFLDIADGVKLRSVDQLKNRFSASSKDKRRYVSGHGKGSNITAKRQSEK